MNNTNEMYFIYFTSEEQAQTIAHALVHYDSDWYWTNDIRGKQVIEAPRADAEVIANAFGVAIKSMKEAMTL